MTTWHRAEHVNALLSLVRRITVWFPATADEQPNATTNDNDNPDVYLTEDQRKWPLHVVYTEQVFGDVFMVDAENVKKIFFAF